MDNLDPLRWAKFFAKVKHGDQKYDKDKPYTYHLAQVEKVLRDFQYQDDLILNKAAWLHDTLEDTDTTFQELRSLFGMDIANLVYAVTNEQGRNRAERHLKTYPKIKVYGRKAIILKLADRIANVQMGGDMVKAYRKEYVDFKNALCQDKDDPMWLYLDKLLS